MSGDYAEVEAGLGGCVSLAMRGLGVFSVRNIVFIDLEWVDQVWVQPLIEFRIIESVAYYRIG